MNKTHRDDGAGGGGGGGGGVGGGHFPPTPSYTGTLK